MLPKYFVGFLFCVSMILSHAVSGQSDTLQPGRFSIKFSPQHLLFNGIHLDAEKSLGADSRHSIIFSPRLYSGKTRTLDNFTRRSDEPDDKGSVIGYGAEVLHRIYSSGTSHEGLYFAYGVNYHYFNVEFVKEGWVQQMDEQGLEVYKYRERPFNEKINRWGAVAMIGVQRPLSVAGLLVDLYVGFGHANSDISSDYSTERYNVNIYDFGYTGVYVLGGFKFGMMF